MLEDCGEERFAGCSWVSQRVDGRSGLRRAWRACSRLSDGSTPVPPTCRPAERARAMRSDWESAAAISSPVASGDVPLTHEAAEGDDGHAAGWCSAGPSGRLADSASSPALRVNPSSAAAVPAAEARMREQGGENWRWMQVRAW